MPEDQPVSAREIIPVALLLAFAVWAAHFWHFRQFGLYEDDWGFVGHPLSWDFLTFCRITWEYLTGWPQGRPVSFTCSGILALIGVRLGGVPGAYLTGFLVNLASTLLFYRIVRLSLPPSSALCGAVAFNVVPSITSFGMLTNTFMPGVGLFFLLVTLWFYLRSRLIPTYVFALFTLLSYESCFLPLFAAPLLRPDSGRRLPRECARHWAILLGMAAAVLAIRHWFHEAKVATLGATLGDSLARIFHAMYLGPCTTLMAYVQRPKVLWQERNPEIGMVVVGTTLIIGLGLWWLGKSSPEVSYGGKWSDPRVRMVAGGVAMLVLAYGLAITPPYYPPVVMNGRITGLHFAASVGCGLLFSALCAFLLDLARRPVARSAVVMVVSFYLAVLIGFQHRVQLDFIRGWQFQRQFWQSVVRLCPDITDGTLIIYEKTYLPVAYVSANSWADATILDSVYSFPKDWRGVPRVFSLPDGWRNEIRIEGDQFTWSVPAGLWPPHRDVLPKGKLILLEGTIGEVKLTRLTGSVEFQGKPFPLKPVGPPMLAQYPKGPFYPLLFDR